MLLEGNNLELNFVVLIQSNTCILGFICNLLVTPKPHQPPGRCRSQTQLLEVKWRQLCFIKLAGK